jgi:hypothetical protein
MRFIGQGRGRIVVAAIVLLMAGGVGVAVAAGTSSPPSNAVRAGHGINEFGLTRAYLKGHSVQVRYTKGFYCDTRVSSAASTKCEGGARWKKPPASDFDPLYITVPLGFKVRPMHMECPDKLVCVDHPGTIDLTRLEPALKPLYPQLTDAQLTEALKNFETPGHNHFITTRAGGVREWWDVRIVGVTDRTEYNKITRHASARFLLHEVKAGRTTGVIPTNMFLFFAVK